MDKQNTHGKTGIKIYLKIGNKVRVYNSYNKMLDITGQIVQEIPSENGISRSFLIRDKDGIEVWRPAKFIKIRATQ